ncbi:MAG: tetratricopeptide repeat protein [Deltaproteobacteria bacterium]|nr:tetratricopeptide repeat protein [Deltaproteobacteria bacterium]
MIAASGALGGAAWLVLGLVAVARPSFAADAKDEASRLLKEGNEAIRTGRAEDALRAFKRAYEAYPSPKIRINLAEAYRQTGDLGAAVREYERYLDETDDPSSKIVKAARQRVDELLPRTARVEVLATRGDSIWVDDVKVGTAPVDPFAVTPGRRRIRVGPLGAEATYPVDAVAGQRHSVEATRSEPVVVAPPPPAPTPTLGASKTPEIPVERTAPVVAAKPRPAPPLVVTPRETDADDGIATKWWFWTIIVVAVAGVGVGVAAAAGGTEAAAPPELGSTKITDGWTRL